MTKEEAIKEIKDLLFLVCKNAESVQWVLKDYQEKSKTSMKMIETTLDIAYVTLTPYGYNLLRDALTILSPEYFEQIKVYKPFFWRKEK